VTNDEGLILGHLDKQLKRINCVKNFITDFDLVCEDTEKIVENFYEKLTLAIIVRKW